MTIHPIAAELDERIARANPRVLEMLSARGRAIYFPSRGILGQSAEARGRRINATIGIALEDDGSPLCLPGVASRLDLDPRDAFPYAPSFGKPELRDRWQAMIRAKNPSLGDAPISRPVVTAALTHALSMCGYLFLDPDDRVIVPDLYWGNYGLIFQRAYDAALDTYPTFAGGGFNVDGLRARLADGPPGKRVVLLNFPNNPTGYTPTDAEARAVADALVEAAEAGNDVVVLIDDAYFGLVYEDGVFRESMFALLAGAHERLLAVKIDGATKEDYAWGFRVGFVTYGVRGGTADLYDALESKTAGAIRGNISNAPHVAQSLLLRAFEGPDYAAQKKARYDLLRRRYDEVRAVLERHPEYRESFEPMPFNSGYFMCVRLKKHDPETVRQILLRDFDTGLIAASGLLRVAFSSTPTHLLAPLFANIHAACARADAG